MKNKKPQHFLAVNLHKNNIEPHQNFTGSYKKNIEVLDKLQDTQNIEKVKG